MAKGVEVYMRSGRIIFLVGGYEHIKLISEGVIRFEGNAMSDAYGNVPPKPILIYTSHIEFLGPEFEIPVEKEEEAAAIELPDLNLSTTEVGIQPNGDTPWRT